jgi:nucleoside-diphosphate-sugar epimerase
MERSLPTVLITGVSGFLGSQVCNCFLLDGGYQVRGTVRSATNENKIKPLRDAYGASYKDLKLVEADLLDSNSIQNAMQGCDYVVHTASPFRVSGVKDENELIKPAVEGTLAVMRGALKHKVKRVVITSSCASIFYKKQQ